MTDRLPHDPQLRATMRARVRLLELRRRRADRMQTIELVVCGILLMFVLGTILLLNQGN